MVDFLPKEQLKIMGKKGGKAMKRDWSKFQAKAVVASPEKQNRANMGRPCCGGSCIGGNCKAVPKIANIFK
jgi:hypothetical protein